MKLIAYEHTAHVHHHAAHHSHIHLHGLKLSHSWFLVSVVHVFTTLCGVLYARCVGLSRVICKFAVINDGHSIIWHCSFKSHSLHHLLSASGPQWCSCQKLIDHMVEAVPHRKGPAVWRHGAGFASASRQATGARSLRSGAGYRQPYILPAPAQDGSRRPFPQAPSTKPDLDRLDMMDSRYF